MIYLDNAATTKSYDSSLSVFTEASDLSYFNPSALYKQSVEAAKMISGARAGIMSALGVSEGDLYFMSGGTEADNMALFCSRKARGSRIIVSAGEHDAVINPANELKAQGYDVVFAPINTDGSVDEAEFEKLLSDNVSLVSIMHVSNETGAVNNIKRLSKLTKKYSPDAIFHSDGVQAFCKIPVMLAATDVDLYSISGHKIHAPKGIGALYVKKGTKIKPMLYGGGQEKGMRSGTENLPLVLAFFDAVKQNKIDFDLKYSEKRDYLQYFAKNLIEKLPNTVVITDMQNSAPHILTVAFDGIRGEVLLHTLENHDILVGIGSACSSHRESRFKSLLGLDNEHRDGIVRFSISEFNKIEEIDGVINAICEETSRLKEFARK